MKKIYLKPELEVYNTNTELLFTADSDGYMDKDEVGAKGNDIIFDDDSFGDTWGVDSNNLWGDEE